jgi:hypothetical protein
MVTNTYKTCKDEYNASFIFWVDKLSLYTLWQVFRKGNSQSIAVHFMERTNIGWFLFLCMRSLRIIKFNAAKAEYSMGDMRFIDGGSLLYEAYRVTSEVTIAMVKGLRAFPMYQKLISILPSNKVALYFEKRIYNEIFPIIKLLCIVRWYIHNGDEHRCHSIIWRDNDFFNELQYAWPDKTVVLTSYRYLFSLSWIRSYIKKLYNLGQDIFAYYIRLTSLKPCPNEKSCIAVHYAEGIDLKRRSDLFWYQGSMIDAKRVIIYFDRSYNHSITKEHTRQIESMGMRWLSLCWRGDVPFSIRNVWRPPLKKYHLLVTFREENAHCLKEISMTEKWLFKAGIDLLNDIGYWQAFYQMFNVKIHIDAVEGGLQNIAQNIALDFVGGICVGKQRSEWTALISDLVGCYPDHVFFSWNCQSPTYLQKNKNENDYCIISGFPFDSTFSEKRSKNLHIRKSLHDRGVKFVIALYDNMYGDDNCFSKAMMLSFYKNFLEWVIEDREVWLVIKSKKPQILNNMTEIRNLLIEANSTGRCVLMDNEYGRLPSEAAFVADIAVGIGISSALSEAVIAGCRGIHCDLTKSYSHLFYYKWGYKKIIFDDIDELMAALRRFKENPQNEPCLGDFSPAIDQLDPFRDGRAGERAGTYMRWFLEAVDAGEIRDRALQWANERYAKDWGVDKVIEMQSIPPFDVLLEQGVKLGG